VIEEFPKKPNQCDIPEVMGSQFCHWAMLTRRRQPGVKSPLICAGCLPRQEDLSCVGVGANQFRLRWRGADLARLVALAINASIKTHKIQWSHQLS